MDAAVDLESRYSIKVFKNDYDVSKNVCMLVADIANKAISDRDIFIVGVSGGSLAKFLCDGLPSATTDWSKWRVFFCDERHVPYTDDECTYKYYKQHLLSKVPLQEQHIYPANPDTSVEEDAKQYTEKLKTVFGDNIPRFDLLLLGMGPDGHTCSLFPGHKLLQETTMWVAPISDSPKPPPERITLTMPVLNNARYAVFVSCGASKAEILQRVLEGREEPPLPAASVRPHSGQLYWFLDKPAARLLKVAQL